MASKRKSQRLEAVRGAIATVAERDDKGLDKGKDRGCEEEGTSRWWDQQLLTTD